MDSHSPLASAQSPESLRPSPSSRGSVAPKSRAPGSLPRTKDFRRTTFTKSDRVVVRALAEAMFGEDGDVSEDKLDRFVVSLDAFVSPASPGLRFGLRAMLFFFHWSPILLFLAGSTFENLPVKERVKVLEKVDRSRIALASLSLVACRTIMTMVFYEDREELALLGYPGDERKTYLRLAKAEPTSSGPAFTTPSADPRVPLQSQGSAR